METIELEKDSLAKVLKELLETTTVESIVIKLKPTKTKAKESKPNDSD